MATDPTGRISHLPDMHRDQTWKQAVRVATTANGTLASAYENGDTVDGVTLATGDRILIKNQTTGSENGIYTVNASGAPTRAFDMDQDGTTAVPAAEVYGAVIWVVQGTTNAGTLWYCTNTGTITLGSTALTFSQFSSGISGVTVQDEGTPLSTAATTLDFVGAGVTATGSGATKTITIPGGASALDDLSDVTLTSPATADRLRFDGSVWRNSALKWIPVTVYDPTTGNYLPAVDGSGNAIMTEA